MRLKRLLTVCITGSFILGSITTAFADEPETSTTETDTTETGSWLEEQLIDSFSTLDFKLVDAPDSAALLNLKYMNLQAAIIDNGYGNNYEITLPDSLEISGNASDLFDKEYGDIDFTLEKIDIPEDFNAESILQNSKDMVNAGYSEFINSENYKSIYNAVSTFATTNEIDKQISSSSDISKLMDSGKMKELLSQYGDDNKAKDDYYSSSGANKNNTETAFNSVKNGYLTSKNTNKETINTIKTWVKNRTAIETTKIDKSSVEKFLSLYEDSGSLGTAFADRMRTLKYALSTNDTYDENAKSSLGWDDGLIIKQNGNTYKIEDIKEPGSTFKSKK